MSEKGGRKGGEWAGEVFVRSSVHVREGAAGGNDRERWCRWNASAVVTKCQFDKHDRLLRRTTRVPCARLFGYRGCRKQRMKAGNSCFSARKVTQTAAIDNRFLTDSINPVLSCEAASFDRL